MSDLNLSRMTVKELDVLIKNEGGRSSRLMKKADKIKYLEGLIWEEANLPIPIQIKTIPYSKLNKTYMRPEISVIDHIIKYGWATIPIQNLDVDLCVNAFWNWLESCHLPGQAPKLKRDNPQTWIEDNIPPQSSGIFRSHLGHTEWSDQK